MPWRLALVAFRTVDEPEALNPDTSFHGLHLISLMPWRLVARPELSAHSRFR
jgi:hypothetical protein